MFKRIILSLMLVLFVCNSGWATFLGTKQASENVYFSLNPPLDSLYGIPRAPDSVHIFTYADGDMKYSVRSATYPFTAAGIDTIKHQGDTVYKFLDVIADIDGAGGNFLLGIDVALFYDKIPTWTFATVQIIKDSLNERFDNTIDSVIVDVSSALVTDGLLAVAADTVWEELLTGATHNTATSSGRRLRTIDAAFVLATGQAQVSGTPTDPGTYIILAAATSEGDDFFNHATITIDDGTGIGQSRAISDYTGADDSASLHVGDDWITDPDATSTYVISPGHPVEVVTYHSDNALDQIWEYDVLNITTTDGIGDSLMSLGDSLLLAKLSAEQALDSLANILDSLETMSTWIQDSLYAIIDSIQIKFANRLAYDPVTDSVIVDGTIFAGLTNIITSTNVADNSIDAGAIATDAIGASELATDAIGAAELATSAIDEIVEYDTALVSGAQSWVTMLKDTLAYQGSASGLTASEIWTYNIPDDTTAGAGDDMNAADLLFRAGDTTNWANIVDVWRNQDSINVDTSEIGDWLIANLSGTSGLTAEEIMDSLFRRVVSDTIDGAYLSDLIRLCKEILDTLQLQDDWVAQNAYFDTLIYNFGVWVDAGANTNTVVGVDGTPKNPVGTIAAAKTIADALGYATIYLLDGANETIGETMEHYRFVGITRSAVIDLGGQDVDGSFFECLTVTGEQGGTGLIVISNAGLTNVDSLEIHARNCAILGNLSLRGGTSFFDKCYSSVPGNTTPVLDFRDVNVAVGINWRAYSGGLELKNMTVDHTISYEADGQLIINANCDNGNITARGMMQITNSGTSMNITDDAVWNRTDIFDPTIDSLSKIFDSLSAVLDTLQAGVKVASIVTDAITADAIATNAIGALEISPDAIGSSEIQTNAIGADEIDANAIGESEIAANAITSSEFHQTAVAKITDAVQDDISIRAIVEASGSNSDTQVQTNLVEGTDNHYNGMMVLFKTGAEMWQARRINDYTGGTGVIQWNFPLVGNPQSGDSIRIMSWASVSVAISNADMAAIGDTVWSKLLNEFSAVPGSAADVLLDSLNLRLSEVSGGGGSDTAAIKAMFVNNWTSATAGLGWADMLADSFWQRAFPVSGGTFEDSAKVWGQTSASALDSAFFSRILGRKIWGIADGSGDDSSTISQRLVNPFASGGKTVTLTVTDTVNTTNLANIFILVEDMLGNKYIDGHTNTSGILAFPAHVLDSFKVTIFSQPTYGSPGQNATGFDSIFVNSSGNDTAITLQLYPTSVTAPGSSDLIRLYFYPRDFQSNKVGGARMIVQVKGKELQDGRTKTPIIVSEAYGTTSDATDSCITWIDVINTRLLLERGRSDTTEAATVKYKIGIDYGTYVNWIWEDTTVDSTTYEVTPY
jgi:hypothetical protein